MSVDMFVKDLYKITHKSLSVFDLTSLLGGNNRYPYYNNQYPYNRGGYYPGGVGGAGGGMYPG